MVPMALMFSMLLGVLHTSASSQVGVKIRFDQSFPLSSLARTDESKGRFQVDLISQLSALLKVPENRVSLNAVLVPERTVEVAFRESVDNAEKAANQLASDLEKIRNDKASDLWSQSLTSYFDPAYPIITTEVKPTGVTAWTLDASSASPIVPEIPSSRKTASAQQVQDLFVATNDIVTGYTGELFYYVGSKIESVAIRYAGFSVSSIVSKFGFLSKALSFWQGTRLVGFLATIFVGVFTLSVAYYIIGPNLVVQTDGVVVDIRPGRHGPGRRSPYKSQVNFYYSPSSNKASPIPGNTSRVRSSSGSPRILDFIGSNPLQE